jgi:hypothetical protein
MLHACASVATDAADGHLPSTQCLKLHAYMQRGARHCSVESTCMHTALQSLKLHACMHTAVLEATCLQTCSKAHACRHVASYMHADSAAQVALHATCLAEGLVPRCLHACSFKRLMWHAERQASYSLCMLHDSLCMLHSSDACRMQRSLARRSACYMPRSACYMPCASHQHSLIEP